MFLKNIYGNLSDAYKKCVPGTVLCVDQLINECTNNPITENGGNLRRLEFFTADSEVYFLERGTPMLAITREATNPVLKNIDAILDQLDRRRYTPVNLTRKAVNLIIKNTDAIKKVSKVDFASVKNASDTVFVDLSQLRLLTWERSGQGYLGIRFNDGYIFNGKHYVPANPEESKMMIRYGYTPEHLRLLSKGKKKRFGRITETRIAVEKPNHMLKEAETGPFWKIPLFNGYDYSIGSTNEVHSENENFLRGVPLVSRANRKGGKENLSLNVLNEILTYIRKSPGKSSIHPDDEERLRNLFMP